MNEEPTTVVLQRYLDALRDGRDETLIVRDLLERAADRLRLLSAALLRRSYRYRAAAVVGSGADNAAVDEPDRASWRQRARDWLRLDLAAWANRLETSVPAERADVQKTVAQWQEEPDLAGLRDADLLEKLPPAERHECLALWQEVEDLILRAQAAK